MMGHWVSLLSCCIRLYLLARGAAEGKAPGAHAGVQGRMGQAWEARVGAGQGQHREQVQALRQVKMAEAAAEVQGPTGAGVRGCMWSVLLWQPRRRCGLRAVHPGGTAGLSTRGSGARGCV